MRPEINSNDFGRFGAHLADSNSNVVVVEIIAKQQFDFMCSGFIHTQRDYTCTCAVACFDTCVDVAQQMQIHNRPTHSTGTSHLHSNCGS